MENKLAALPSELRLRILRYFVSRAPRDNMRMLGIPPGKLNVPALTLSSQLEHRENESILTIPLPNHKFYSIKQSVDPAQFVNPCLPFDTCKLYLSCFIWEALLEVHSRQSRNNKWLCLLPG